MSTILLRMIQHFCITLSARTKVGGPKADLTPPGRCVSAEDHCVAPSVAAACGAPSAAGVGSLPRELDPLAAVGEKTRERSQRKTAQQDPTPVAALPKNQPFRPQPPSNVRPADDYDNTSVSSSLIFLIDVNIQHCVCMRQPVLQYIP